VKENSQFINQHPQLICFKLGKCKTVTKLCPTCLDAYKVVQDNIWEPDSTIMKKILELCKKLPGGDQKLCNESFGFLGENFIVHIRRNMGSTPIGTCRQFRLCQ
jgi:hypothetical protein